MGLRADLSKEIVSKPLLPALGYGPLFLPWYKSSYTMHDACNMHITIQLLQNLLPFDCRLFKKDRMLDLPRIFNIYNSHQYKMLKLFWQQKNNEMFCRAQARTLFN